MPTVSRAKIATVLRTALWLAVVACAAGSPTSPGAPLTPPTPPTPPAPPPPPPATALTSVSLSPDSVTIGTATSLVFSTSGRFSDGTTAPIAAAFTATGGTIDSTGRFTAGAGAGTFRVIATADGGRLADTSQVTLQLVVAPITSCAVAPATVTVTRGGTQTFAATGRRSDGTAAPATVTWTATGGSITSNGLFTAGTMAGSYRVLATVVGTTIACASDVTVLPPPPPADSVLNAVVLSPATVALTAGAAQQFTAVGTWSTGSGGAVSVTYSATGGTVSAGGLYTAGSTAGTYRIIATAQGGTRADTSAITVTAPPPVGSGPITAECAAPQAAWIFCDDFEQDRLARYFEVDNAGGRFARVAGTGVNGSSAMRGTYATTTQTSSGSLKMAFGRTPSSYFRPVDAGTSDYREVYWRVYVRNAPGWTGGGGDKLTRATSLVSSTWAQSMIAHVWSGGPPDENYLFIDPASGTDAAGVVQTTSYNDFTNFRWLGSRRGTTQLFASASIGAWHCVEAHVRLNDAGQTNGIFELWVNGTLETRRADLNWVGAYAGYGINAVFLENYWNAGAPRAQDRALDNFVVSQSRIGC